MNWNVLTIFPKMILNYFEEGVVGQVFQHAHSSLKAINPRDFAEGNYKAVDDRAYGGGHGMVMSCEVLEKALQSIEPSKKGLVVYLTPQGKVLNEEMVLELSKYENLTLICGRYEGIDQRLLDHYVDKEISIGDFVISGGELAACVLIDAVMRKKEGTLGNSHSAANDSFANGLLEAPLYTKPSEWKRLNVPEVLISGDHDAIRIWKDLKSLQVTYEKRPDLFQKYWLILQQSDRVLRMKDFGRLLKKYPNEELDKFLETLKDEI